ncbi:MAG: hypothetical protein GX352_03790 [Clostridiales bacterium]|nr:hypothetical protein [Clostridiales bacterium]
MPQLFIIIIIVSVVINFVKFVNKSRQVQTKGIPGKGLPGSQGAGSLSGSPQWVAPELIFNDNAQAQEDPGTLKAEPRSKSGISSPMRRQVQTMQKTNMVSRRVLSNMTRAKLVEGIILSEILAPPKSKRSGVR